MKTVENKRERQDSFCKQRKPIHLCENGFALVMVSRGNRKSGCGWMTKVATQGQKAENRGVKEKKKRNREIRKLD